MIDFNNYAEKLNSVYLRLTCLSEIISDNSLDFYCLKKDCYLDFKKIDSDIESISETLDRLEYLINRLEI